MSLGGGFNGSFFLPRSWVPMIQFDGRAYFSNGWKNHQLQNLIFRPSQVTRLYWHLPTLPPDKTYRCATGLTDYGWRWERWVAPNSNGSQIQKNTIFYTMVSNILGRIYDVFKTVHVKNAGHLYMHFSEVISKKTSQWSCRYCRGSLWNQHVSALATGLKKWVQLRRKKSLLFWCWITNLYRV